jgi:hypothetical protein
LAGFSRWRKDLANNLGRYLCEKKQINFRQRRDKMKIKPQSKIKNIVVQEINDDLLIYDLDTNKAVCLNQTAGLVWKACDGKNEIPMIAKYVGRQLGKPVTDELIWLAIDQLKNENLLLNSATLKTRFEGLSRREIIKKAGFASMVALPTVSSIIAPEAIAAQSGVCAVPVGQCTPPNIVNVCPPECTGSTINATFYNVDTTCNPASVTGMNSFLCNGNPRVFNEAFIITSIT